MVLLSPVAIIHFVSIKRVLVRSVLLTCKHQVGLAFALIMNVVDGYHYARNVVGI